MKLLQRNLNRSMFRFFHIYYTMRQVRFKFRCNILISGKIIKEMPGSVARGSLCIMLNGGYTDTPVLYAERPQYLLEWTVGLVSHVRKMAKKVTISFAMYVCPSVCPHEPTWLPLDGFSWKLIFQFFFEKTVEKIQVSLKRDKNSRCFTWRPRTIFLSYLAQFFLEWEMFRKKLYRKLKHTFYIQ